MTLLLCGFQGSGKSTVGEALAQRWKCRFIDTDHEMERRENRSIRKLYAELGQRRFRQLERKVVDELSCGERSVIALGGGTLLDPKNQERLRPLGPIVYLELPLSLLRERWEGDPSFAPTPKMQESAFADRVEIYQTICDHTIPTAGLEVEEVIEEVVRTYGE